jgi:hypothetical protein
MEDENIKAATATGTRRPRQGEAFWGEMTGSGGKHLQPVAQEAFGPHQRD